jgi:signal transduction histidine kinase
VADSTTEVGANPSDGGLPLFAAVDIEDLLAELRVRAGASRAVHERMRGLLDAVMAVSADLDLPSVLERIVTAACQLSGARYGALGVLGQDDHLVEFVTHGVTAEERAAIGDLPHGRGLLGLLIRDPRPVRLPDIAGHEASVGFPPNHPPMRSFLGVPVRAGGAVFGNLYLSEKQGAAEFTAEDEEVVVGLAAAAGAAVDKARLYAESERRRRWLEATAEIRAALLSRTRRSEVLGLVARLARENAAADYAAVLLSADADELVVEVADGPQADLLLDQTVRASGALAGVVAGGPPVLTGDAMFRGLPAGPALLAALRPDPETSGALVVGWSGTNRQSVGAPDVEMLAAFAEQAALALELARGQSDRARLAVYEDRDRIARDLHDSVVQRLFAVGLSLRGVTRGTLSPEDSARRAERAVDDLDATVKDIRRTIFKLHTRPGEGNLDADLEAVAAAAEGSLGFAPELHISGLTSTVSPPLAENVLAVAREGLANVARHAQASAVRVDVDVDVDRDSVTVAVTDDGLGMPAAQTRRSGLANMSERARLAGGTFSVARRDVGGTRLTWTAPLRA